MNKKPLILSLNVPLCPVRCSYCDRCTSAVDNLDLLNLYADALRREVQYSAGDYGDYQVQAVWIGGGIPSHLFDEALGDLLRDMRNWFDFTPDAEITLKAHPGMVSVETVNACRRGNISRLSIEYVTANTFEHEPLGRFLPPSAMETTKIVLQNTSLTLSFDLLLGLPSQTPGTFAQSLSKVIDYGAKHISLYPIRIVKGTPFADQWVKMNEGSTALRRHLPDASERDALIAAADALLCKQGFMPYLSGHYALKGFACRYLQLEHEGCEQLAFGAGAESRIDGFRSRNTQNIADYCRFSPDPRKLTQFVCSIAADESQQAFSTQRHGTGQCAARRDPYSD